MPIFFSQILNFFCVTSRSHTFTFLRAPKRAGLSFYHKQLSKPTLSYVSADLAYAKSGAQ